MGDESRGAVNAAEDDEHPRKDFVDGLQIELLLSDLRLGPGTEYRRADANARRALFDSDFEVV